MSKRRQIALRAPVYVLFGAPAAQFLLWAIGVTGFLLGLIVTARFWTEVMWFESVGYLDVFWTLLRVKIVMGGVPFLVMFCLVAGNLFLAKRLAPLDRVISADERRIDEWHRMLDPLAHQLIIVVAILCGLFIALRTYPEWEAYLLWVNGEQWGRADPQFGRDLEYFVFGLPVYTLINTWLFIGVLVTTILSALTHYLYGGVRPQAPGAKVPLQVNIHISALLLALMALIGWGLLLDLHMLSYSERGVITGLGFTDANASLIAYRFIAVGVVTGFVLIQINIRKPGWILPSLAVMWLFLLGLTSARVYPALFQLLFVEPQELERERPYIEDHLAFTRYGFGLDEVERRQTTGTMALGASDMEEFGRVLGQVRLWDPDTLRINFLELQALRTYFDFHDVDVDRYEVDGELVPVMIAAREVDIDRIPDGARRWENERMIYSHGFGLVASSVSEATPAGLPKFFARDLPPVGLETSTEQNQQVYFGELSPPYSVVDTGAVELNRPSRGPGVATTEYHGAAGVATDTLLRRLLFAVRFWDLRLALTVLLEDGSRVLYHRRVRDRIHKVAPFLRVDRNPYPAAVGGRIVWIVECYTVSDMMPYSKRVSLSDLTQTGGERGGNSGPIPDEFIRNVAGLEGTANYVRGSVKAVVDAYHGTVRFYVVDPDDRVLRAWRRAFPGVFLPAASASEELRAHFRYPEDLFRIQSVVWSDYHMETAEAFYTREGAWRIPPDAAFISLRRERKEAEHEQRRKDLRPYWLYTRFPASDEDEFAIVQPFTPEDRNVMTGYLVGHSDGSYDRLTSYAFPPTTTVLGPPQAQARIDQDARISAWMTLRMQSGSRVSRGRLIALPVGEALLYVQPLFVQADKSEVSSLLGAELSSIPELKKVVIVFGDNVVMRDTLAEAVRAVFGNEALPRSPRPRVSPDLPPGIGGEATAGEVEEPSR